MLTRNYRRWKCTRAPRSTLISSDNDSFRWNVYLLVTRGEQAPKPHRVLAIVFHWRFGTSIQVRCQGVYHGTRTRGDLQVILDKRQLN